MDKTSIAKTLSSMADLIELESDNTFRSRSYRSGSRALEGFQGDLGELVETGKVSSIKGIGASIAAVVVELWETDSSPRLVELLDAVPSGVRDLLGVPGLGPKKIRSLWKELGIESLEALVEACESHRVSELSGFGKKTEEKILQGVEYLQSVSDKRLWSEAAAVVAQLLERLRACPDVERVEVAGSFRRRKEVVRDLDFVASSQAPEAVSAWFVETPGVADVIAQGSTKTAVRFEGGLAVDLRVVRDDQFAATLCHFTGSKEHNVALRQRAKDRDLKLSEYGVFRGDEVIECTTEAEIHAELGLAYIEPELRENLGEVEAAESGALPELLSADDIRGVVHLHTTWSDGKASLRDMAEAARERGYEYIGLSDHSQSAAYAGGLKPEQVLEQHAEADRLNEEYAGEFRIWKGIESDILPDGSLDYEDDILDTFDFVIGSLHSSFQQPLEQMTARVLRAVENPRCTFLGHPTTRLLLRREGVALDMDRVLAAAAEHGVVVEINANPWRLDLDWRHGPRARQLGVRTGIHPDAHSIQGIDDIRFGVGIARKAGFSAAEVVNTLDLAGFGAFLEMRRERFR